MPAPSVVIGTGEAAENALRIHPGAKGGDDLSTASAEMLGQGQNRRRHGDSGMAGHGGMNVVVVVGMAGGAVEQCGLAHGGPDWTAYELGLGMTALRVDFRCQNVGQRLVRAGNRDADEVHQRLAGHRPRRLGNAFGAGVNDTLSQLPCSLHGIHPQLKRLNLAEQGHRRKRSLIWAAGLG